LSQQTFRRIESAVKPYGKSANPGAQWRFFKDLQDLLHHNNCWTRIARKGKKQGPKQPIFLKTLLNMFMLLDVTNHKLNNLTYNLIISSNTLLWPQ